MSRPSPLERARLTVSVRRRRAQGIDAGPALGKLLDHAARNSPWYREQFGGAAPADLDRWPVPTKDDLVDHFDQLVTHPGLHLADLDQHLGRAAPGTRYRGWWIGITSGSSGRPAVVALDRHEWADRIADAARAVRVAGPPLGGGRVRSAKIGGSSPWHLSAQVGASLTDPRRPTLRLPATTPFPRMLDEIGRWRPQVLTAYASVLARLADAQLSGDLDIAPSRVHSGAEMLTGATRELVRRAWGLEVFDQFVTTETGFVAVECEAHAGLHLLEDRLVVEVVDAAGAPVPEGELGHHLLVTVLPSRTVPFVRYRLDDSVRLLAGPCPCGRTWRRIEPVGRARDLIRLGDADVHPVALSLVMDRCRLARWQAIVHRGPEVEVVVAGTPEGFDPEHLRIELAASLAAGAGTDVPVRVVEVDDLEPEASGKAARVVIADQ